jgi:putative tryptophan/tyrosine transport system substrate-binding protein
MRRREFIAGLGGVAAWPAIVYGQRQAVRPIVGVLFPVSVEASQPNLTALRKRLAELGYVEGQNFDFAIRNAQVPNRDAGLKFGGELLALSPAVIVMGAPKPMLLAIHELTLSVPVVFVNLNDDPVALGLVASVAHPGGNITGFRISSDPAIVGKQLALLKELAPSIVRVDALLEAGDTASESLIPGAARNLGLNVRAFSISRGEEIAPIIAEARGNADALLFGAGPVFNTRRNEIAAVVARSRLPAVYHDLVVANAGGLMAYGTSIPKNYAAAADYVAKILSGVKPGDLPIQQPAFYELVINLKTAKALGLDIPPALLARADEVIE